MQFREFDSAAAFLDRAGSYLQRRESENSLLLGIALRSRDVDNPGDAGARFFVIENRAEVEGAVLQTPGRAAIFTLMGPAAARVAAQELPHHLDPLHGCLGPVESVEVVAQVWRDAGLGPLRNLMDTRLFELTELKPPRVAPGALRLADEADFSLCQRWSYRFAIECKLPEATPGTLPLRVPALEQRRLYLWEVQGTPVACAAWARPLPDGVSIGLVYTPDELRGRGYASNAVAALTAGLLDGSLMQPARVRVNLFTDLANPTSNSIYGALGYRPLRDFRHYAFEEQRS